MSNLRQQSERPRRRAAGTGVVFNYDGKLVGPVLQWAGFPHVSETQAAKAAQIRERVQ